MARAQDKRSLDTYATHEDDSFWDLTNQYLMSEQLSRDADRLFSADKVDVDFAYVDDSNR